MLIGVPLDDLLAAVMSGLIFDAWFRFALLVARDVECIGVCLKHTVSVDQYCDVGSQQKSDSLEVGFASFYQLLCVVLYLKLDINELVGKVFCQTFKFGCDEDWIGFAAVDGVGHGFDKVQVAGDDIL